MTSASQGPNLDTYDQDRPHKENMFFFNLPEVVRCMHISDDGKRCDFNNTHYRINIITEDQPGGNPEIAEINDCTTMG